MGIWVDEEQQAIEEVLAGFGDAYPNVDVTYIPAGDELVTRLSTAIEGGNPPDLATVAQPGSIADFAESGDIKPLNFAVDAATDNLGASVVETGSVDGELYGILVKVINKATVWYNVQAFEDAGVEPTETWDEFLEYRAKRSRPPVFPPTPSPERTAGRVTDLFENVYIRTAGVEMYDQLARHEIPWTDQSVKDALAEMAKIYGDTDNILGGKAGALQTDNAGSVPPVLSDPPKAAMVIEGDFVPTVTETTLEPVTGYNVFTFPSIDDSPPSVIAAGDFVTMLEGQPRGASAHRVPDDPRGGRSVGVARNRDAEQEHRRERLPRRDLADDGRRGGSGGDPALRPLRPPALGVRRRRSARACSSSSRTFWSNPDDIDGITQQMEDAANEAYGLVGDGRSLHRRTDSGGAPGRGSSRA